MKNNIFIKALTSVVCLLPIFLGLAVYNDLPENVAMQWGFDGSPNWFAPKEIAIFAMPIIFAVLNIFVLTILYSDPKRGNVSKKMRTISQWIVPFISILIVPVILFKAMDVGLPVTLIVFILLGVIFIIIGNYLPKCKQNYTVGLRFPWTLNDSENWNKTHRLAGYLWTFGGIMFIIFAFLSLKNYVWIFLPFLILVLLIITIPALYSYSLYKKSTNKTNNQGDLNK